MYIYHMVKILFPEWLEGKLREKNLIPFDITKRTGLSSAQVSRILSGERSPGVDALIAIADALRLPREEVFRAAGLLNDKNKDAVIEVLAYRISLLPEPQQKFIDALIETLLNKPETGGLIEPEKISAK